MDNGLDLSYERLLGEGSYGKVFLVKQQNGERFAVKEIDLTKCDEDGKTQALGESAILARISHGHILKYVESVINDDCLYIITEYCEGGDLEDYLQTVARCHATIPESLVSEWVLQLGEALKYLHDQKILHRDMKTKNIFLKDDLTVKLGDMGIAKVLDMNQSKADTFIGTPSYMSPELFSGKSYNNKTDIWGLGCCAYEMMTLKRAFQGKALWTLIREIKQGKVLELPDQYSLDMRTLVQEMMSQAPEDRPSAREITQIDLLLYHRGKSKDDVAMLPQPNQVVQDKRKSRNSANLSGSSSGSFNRMIADKKRAEEEEFRVTLSAVVAKINTLDRTGSSMVGEVESTFVYHGDSDSEGELEACNTVLDSSRLKQYTQQLDTLDPEQANTLGTFVYKGEEDSDSDYSTGGSTVKKGDDVRGVSVKGEDEVEVTLLRQYSSHLEELGDDSDLEGERLGAEPAPRNRAGFEDDGNLVWEGQGAGPSPSHSKLLSRNREGVENGVSEGDSGKGLSPVPEPAKGHSQALEAVKGHGGYVKHASSPKYSLAPQKASPKKVKAKADSAVANSEDAEFSSKYKYLGLRDTLSLRPDKKWKRHSETDQLLEKLRETQISEESEEAEIPVKEKCERRKKSGSHRSISLSSSMSSTGSFGGSKTKTSDPRLHKTLSFDGSETKTKAARLKISDRIEQSAKTKAGAEIKLRTTKQAFVESVSEHNGGGTLMSEDQVRDVMSHLRDNLTPYTAHRQPELTDTVKSSGSDDVTQSQDFKGKKKKIGLLKKQSEARKKSVDHDATKDMDVVREGETNIKLFTRAQFASFSKDDDDSNSPGQTNGRQSHQDLTNILTPLHNGGNEILANEQILIIQRELASGIGVDNLRQTLDIMSMVRNEEEMQLHVKNLVGERLFHEYWQHLIILRQLEMQAASTS